MKEELVARIRAAGHEVVDFGAHSLNPDDDYPDYVKTKRQRRSMSRATPGREPGRNHHLDLFIGTNRISSGRRAAGRGLIRAEVIPGISVLTVFFATVPHCRSLR